MQRTTIALEHELLREIRARAAREGRTMAQITNELIHRGLRARATDLERRRPPWRTYSCGPPLVDVTDRDALYDAMDR